MEAKGGFVFVACGAREHIDTLALSLEVLLKKTRHPVWVVTDSTRNEIPVQHDRILDIRTPEKFTHHQASIWLKTSLHRHLPKGGVYVYLDTDILALGNEVDRIFDEFIPPIRFAADHCRLRQFSPYAVNCGCLSANEKHREVVNKLLAEADPLYHTTDPEIIGKRDALRHLFALNRRSKGHSALTALKFVLARKRFYISPEFYYDKSTRIWCDASGAPVMYHVSMRKIAAKAGLRYHRLQNDIRTAEGNSIWRDRCDHLAAHIRRKFGVEITDADWQHWNGGVFIFSDASDAFMDTWHDYTLRIFDDPAWKTRDQGTLIATAWKFGLQQQTALDNCWNMILDYHNPLIEVFDDGQITLDGKERKHPQLVHIYHHWGDENWHIWRKVWRRLHEEAKA